MFTYVKVLIVQNELPLSLRTVLRVSEQEYEGCDSRRAGGS